MKLVHQFNLHCRHQCLSIDTQLVSVRQRDSDREIMSDTIVISSIQILIFVIIQGYGVRDGSIKTVIKLTEGIPITVIYFEQIPWYFRLFLHTLKITTLDDPQREIKHGKRGKFINNSAMF